MRADAWLNSSSSFVINRKFDFRGVIGQFTQPEYVAWDFKNSSALN